MATSVKSTVNHYKNKPATEVIQRLPFISENAEEKLDEFVSVVSKASKRYMKQGRQYIKENPGTGLAIATAVGFVAGTLFSAAFRRQD